MGDKFGNKNLAMKFVSKAVDGGGTRCLGSVYVHGLIYLTKATMLYFIHQVYKRNYRGAQYYPDYITIMLDVALLIISTRATLVYSYFTYCILLLFEVFGTVDGLINVVCIRPTWDWSKICYVAATWGNIGYFVYVLISERREAQFAIFKTFGSDMRLYCK